jgi:chromosome segregation ATPase
MADDKTEHFSNGRSFEERVLSQLAAIDARLSSLEAKVDDRLRETRPIWEKALTEILATREEVKALHTKLDILNDDVLNVRARQRESDLRLKEFEALLHRG